MRRGARYLDRVSETATETTLRWDLTLIAADAEEVKARLAKLVVKSTSLASRYEGQVADLDAEGLLTLLEELDLIKDELRTLKNYGELRLAQQADDPEARDLAIAVERQKTAVENAIRFFELEWALVPAAQVEALCATPALGPYCHWLRAEQRFAPYRLSAAEERVFALRTATALGAWQELHQEQTASLAAPFDSGAGVEEQSLDQLLSYATAPDRELRRCAYEAVYDALEPLAPVLAASYNAVVQDRLSEDRLRGHGDDPMFRTHLENQLPPAVVEAMLAAIEGQQELARRWFRAKGQALGYPLEFHDVYAPLGAASPPVPWASAQAIVLENFERFAPALKASAAGFFHGRIDVEPRLQKTGGAFCAPMSQAVKPFALVNYNERLEDVVTLAHELGHGTQFDLTAQVQPPLVAEAGLALSEVPSTFAEMIVFESVLAREEDPQVRLNLLAGSVEQAFAAIFRQAAMTSFEAKAYAALADGKALRPERLNELWLAEQRGYFGDAVALPDYSAAGWSYIPHFIWTRFYTYAYSFAHLVALALYDLYREDPSFATRYLDFLARGGSASPVEQLKDLGVDVYDPNVWTRSFAELERRITAAVTAAESA
jgi:oligoendopeptidase F